MTYCVLLSNDRHKAENCCAAQGNCFNIKNSHGCIDCTNECLGGYESNCLEYYLTLALLLFFYYHSPGFISINSLNVNKPPYIFFFFLLWTIKSFVSNLRYFYRHVVFLIVYVLCRLKKISYTEFIENMKVLKLL